MDGSSEIGGTGVCGIRGGNVTAPELVGGRQIVSAALVWYVCIRLIL